MEGREEEDFVKEWYARIYFAWCRSFAYRLLMPFLSACSSLCMRALPCSQFHFPYWTSTAIANLTQVMKLYRAFHLFQFCISCIFLMRKDSLLHPLSLNCLTFLIITRWIWTWAIWSKARAENLFSCQLFLWLVSPQTPRRRWPQGEKKCSVADW